MKKINPLRQPRTEADVRKAYKRGQAETIEFAIAVSCLSVCDVFDPTEEQLQAFYAKHKSNVDAILHSRIKYTDILATLKDEYGLEVEFK